MIASVQNIEEIYKMIHSSFILLIEKRKFSLVRVPNRTWILGKWIILGRNYLVLTHSELTGVWILKDLDYFLVFRLLFQNMLIRFPPVSSLLKTGANLHSLVIFSPKGNQLTRRKRNGIIIIDSGCVIISQCLGYLLRFLLFDDLFSYVLVFLNIF